MAAKIPETIAFAALSKSASSKTITGDLPPSSRETTAKLLAEFATICLAVFGPPVNAIRETNG